MQMILPNTAVSRWLTGKGCQTGTVRRHELERRKVLSNSFPGGGSIRCVRGLLWITRDGDSEDILMRGGDGLAFHRHDRLVIEALEDTVVEISSQ